MSDELTALQRQEKMALIAMGPTRHADVTPFLNVMAGLRKYRKAVNEALSLRYYDGDLDSVTVHNLAQAQREIEDMDP